MNVKPSETQTWDQHDKVKQGDMSNQTTNGKVNTRTSFYNQMKLIVVFSMKV